MKIRHARVSDVGAIFLLGKKELAGEKWFDKKILFWIVKNNPELCWVLTEKNRIIGARLFCEAWGDAVWGWLIAIQEEMRNKGLGKLIFEDCCEKLKKQGYKRILTDVDPKNTASVNWHKKTGYKKTGYVKDWFSKGMDAVILCKEL